MCLLHHLTRRKGNAVLTFSLVLSSRQVIKDFSGSGVESITKHYGVF